MKSKFIPRGDVVIAAIHCYERHYKMKDCWISTVHFKCWLLGVFQWLIISKVFLEKESIKS